MGRSRAVFFLPQGAVPFVLQTAYGTAMAHGCTITQAYGPFMHFKAGDAMLTGERHVTVQAADTPQGVQVTVEAWVEGLWNFNVNPHTFVGMIPRRAAWRVVDDLCRRLGVPDPDAVFGHF